MAASPICVAPLPARNRAQRRPLAVTPHRLAANRRNAARSTGPRTAQGKARVARNAIKHGFFAGPERWTSEQQRDFEETLGGLREDFRPHNATEDACVASIAESYVRMAAMLRYENLAALKYHQQCERETNSLIAAADRDEAARLTAHREQLRRAGLWGPTIPGPREARAICRYQGRLDRAIRDATTILQGLRGRRATSSSGVLSVVRKTAEGTFGNSESVKTNPLRASASSGPEALRRPSNAAADKIENAKTNPLSSMFTGNRHQRRRAKAMARRSRPNPLTPFS